MSQEAELICPVCRAKQGWQDTCRRCSADLALYVKALRSQQWAKRRGDAALTQGDNSEIQRCARYLTWLAGTRC